MKYTIQRGDTLWSLARKHGVTVDELMRLNPQIKDRNKIFAGRTLNLPDTGGAPSTNATPAASGQAPADAATSPIPSPQPLPLQPPMLPMDYQPAASPDMVAMDEAQAAQGMAAMDPITAAALMGVRPQMMAAGMGKAVPPPPISLTGQIGPTTAREAAVTGGGMTWADLLYGRVPQMASASQVTPWLAR